MNINIQKQSGIPIADIHLENVSGGTYDSSVHRLETVSTNGTEIIYFGTDTCPICGKIKESYFCQTGTGFSCYLCGFGKEYR